VTITPDEFGALPVHYAAKAGMVELVELLLERYPNSAQETDNEGYQILCASQADREGGQGMAMS
jgi:ankyrin repeat protein